jgi:DNA repair exonuclease SbcCD ATPase subunit
LLKEAKKMRKELRASLDDARTRVTELETQNLDAKLEIDSLKASPIVSDEVECPDCPIFLVDLALFKEKLASKCEELDVLRVEVAELKSRPALLGALFCMEKLLRCVLTLFLLRLSLKNQFLHRALHVNCML